MGMLHYFLGIEIYQEDDEVWLPSTSYANKTSFFVYCISLSYDEDNS